MLLGAIILIVVTYRLDHTYRFPNIFWFPSSCSEKFLRMRDIHSLVAGSHAAGGGGATFS
jgi:predicted GNAT superfamily acetyltransferase